MWEQINTWKHVSRCKHAIGGTYGTNKLTGTDKLTGENGLAGENRLAGTDKFIGTKNLPNLALTLRPEPSSTPEYPYIRSVDFLLGSIDLLYVVCRKSTTLFLTVNSCSLNANARSFFFSFCENLRQNHLDLSQQGPRKVKCTPPSVWINQTWLGIPFRVVERVAAIVFNDCGLTTAKSLAPFQGEENLSLYRILPTLPRDPDAYGALYLTLFFFLMSN